MRVRNDVSEEIKMRVAERRKLGDRRIRLIEMSLALDRAVRNVSYVENADEERSIYI